MVIVVCGVCPNGANSTSMWRALRRCTYRLAVGSSSVCVLTLHVADRCGVSAILLSEYSPRDPQSQTCG